MFDIREISTNILELNPDTLYDTIIIGGGPAALTAAVYCMRKGLNAAIITKDIGGQVNQTSTVENYMGYMYIDGIELINKFKEQVSQFKITCKYGLEVKKIVNDTPKRVILSDDSEWKSRSIIIASGESPKKLNIGGEDRLFGRGVSYCTTCDGPFFKNKEVIIVGGGNSGVEGCIDLAKLAKKVTLVQVTDNLTADQVLIEHLSSYKNVEILYNHSLEVIDGKDVVEKVVLKDIKANNTFERTIDGVFIKIGYTPNSDFARDLLEINEMNEIVVDCNCRTNIPGIFAAGDVSSVPYKQIIIAAGEGAKAALSTVNYLNRN